MADIREEAREERERIEQSNEVAGIVIDQLKRVWPDVHPRLDLRYGIADALWAAGYRKVEVTDDTERNGDFHPEFYRGYADGNKDGEANATQRIRHEGLPVTEDMVERAQDSFHEFAFGLEEPLTRRDKAITRQAWRVALCAALGGEQE